MKLQVEIKDRDCAGDVQFILAHHRFIQRSICAVETAVVSFISFRHQRGYFFDCGKYLLFFAAGMPHQYLVEELVTL